MGKLPLTLLIAKELSTAYDVVLRLKKNSPSTQPEKIAWGYIKNFHQEKSLHAEHALGLGHRTNWSKLNMLRLNMVSGNDGLRNRFLSIQYGIIEWIFYMTSFEKKVL